MDRIACAFIPRFELAARSRTDPGLFHRPVAVADLSSREPRLLSLTPPCEEKGLCVGLRASEARALLPSLTILPPDPALKARAETEVLAALSTHAPLLDLDGEGAFFLSLKGLQRLVESEPTFAEQVQATLGRLGFGAGVAVASRAFVAWVAASRDHGIHVVPEGAEPVLLGAVPLSALALPEKALSMLALLGVHTAGQVLSLPKGSLSRRLGPEGTRLERLCQGDELFAHPSASHVPKAPESVSLELDGPVEGLEPLLFVFKSLLDRLLGQLAAARRALAELHVRVGLDDRSSVEHVLKPAEPTLDARALMDVVRLWLSSSPFPSQVLSLTLTATGADAATARQLELFRQREEKEAEALERAVSRLSAAFGQGALVQPRLMDSLRPEARVGWTGPVLRAPPPAPPLPDKRRPSSPPVVLHRLEPPEKVQWSVGRWLRRAGRPPQRVLKVEGPRRLSGEWWRDPFERSYYWLLTSEGELLLAYRDERDGALYLQAEAD